MKIRFGLIGCGDIALAEYKAITVIGNAEISWVMDSRIEHAQSFAETIDAFYTDSLETLLASDVDAVIIAAPHFLHHPISIQAAKAGMHIVLEKPLALNVKEGREILEQCKNHGVTLSLAYVQRYRPVNLKVREMIRNGAVGKLFHIHILDLFEKPLSYWQGGYSGAIKTDWRRLKEKSGGGVLMMNGSHNLDAWLSIAEIVPERVSAFMANRDISGGDVEDEITLCAECSGGVLLTYSSSICAAGSPLHKEIITGSGGTIEIGNPIRYYPSRSWNGFSAGNWYTIPVDEKDSWQDGRETFFNAFVESLVTGSNPPVSGSEAIRVLALVEAAYQSAETGQTVSLAIE